MTARGEPQGEPPPLEIRYPTPPRRERPDVRLPREHGTRRGYRQHRDEAEEPCDACLAANAAYHREYRAARAKRRGER